MFSLWFKWKRTSQEMLRDAQNRLLSRVNSKIQEFFVPIFNETNEIYTIIVSNEDNIKHSLLGLDISVPIVLIHGYGSGVGLWCKNLDAYTINCNVYAFDLLGFGRSSRPNFSNDASEVENRWVESVEEWRKHMKLENFVLLGHSLGGFIASAYAITYPERVSYLILADPWGFKKEPTKLKKDVFSIIPSFSALSCLRASGPFGLKLLYRARQDICAFFDQRNVGTYIVNDIPIESGEAILKNNNNSTTINRDNLHGNVALDYIYHINMRHPSGEIAFKSLCGNIGWPCNPMIERINQLESSVPITFIYGSRSYMDMSSGYKTQNIRSNSYVDVKVIEGSGHQLYAQASEEFNSYVVEICQRVNKGDTFTVGEYKINNRDGFKLSVSSKLTNVDQASYVRRKRTLINNHKMSLDQSVSLDNSPSNRKTSLFHPSGEASDEASD